jgi:acetyltransferase-like isoleucine patch superfamily enzyme
MRVSLNPGLDDGSWGGGSLEVPSEGFNISIGSGVFVASGAIILGGVSIGDHCIVAAGAVVTKNFPSYSFIAGVPAKRIRITKDV